jgi:hypothetical protein
LDVLAIQNGSLRIASMSGAALFRTLANEYCGQYLQDDLQGQVLINFRRGPMQNERGRQLMGGLNQPIWLGIAVRGT